MIRQNYAISTSLERLAFLFFFGVMIVPVAQLVLGAVIAAPCRGAHPLCSSWLLAKAFEKAAVFARRRWIAAAQVRNVWPPCSCRQRPLSARRTWSLLFSERAPKAVEKIEPIAQQNTVVMPCSSPCTPKHAKVIPFPLTPNY